MPPIAVVIRLYVAWITKRNEVVRQDVPFVVIHVMDIVPDTILFARATFAA